jgi:hypothetical protein
MVVATTTMVLSGIYDILACTTTELEEREESQSLDGACIPKPYVKQSRVAS